jgi:chromate transporter
LLDAVAVGQVTPGPLLTTATFVGFVLGYRTFGGGLWGGVIGAVVATASIFLPAFILVATASPWLPRLRNNPMARGALDGMNAAVVALIGVTAVSLSATAIHPPGAVVAGVIAAAALMATFAWDVNSTWVILAAAAVGAVTARMGAF